MNDKDQHLLWEAYLEKHTNFEFDSCVSKPTVQKVNHKNGHTKVFCIFYNVEDYNNNISIENDCLNSITNHSNIVEIKINSTTREFRMHKNRTKINVDL